MAEDTTTPTTPAVTPETVPSTPAPTSVAVKPRSAWSRMHPAWKVAGVIVILLAGSYALNKHNLPTLSVTIPITPVPTATATPSATMTPSLTATPSATYKLPTVHPTHTVHAT